MWNCFVFEPMDTWGMEGKQALDESGPTLSNTFSRQVTSWLIVIWEELSSVPMNGILLASRTS